MTETIFSSGEAEYTGDAVVSASNSNEAWWKKRPS